MKLGSLAILFLSFNILSGCGRWANATKQPTDVLILPEQGETESVFSLKSSLSSIGYGGTMVILNEKAEVSDLTDLLLAAQDSRKAWAEMKEFTAETRYDEWYLEGGFHEKALLLVRKDLQNFISEKKKNSNLDIEVRKASAKSWSIEEINNVVAEDVEKSRKMISLYCDAKIWELATNAQFSKTLYHSRPSPLMLCEEYYEREGYFLQEHYLDDGLQDSNVCASSEVGKRYGRCLWGAVIKTSQFSRLLTKESQEAIKSIVSDDSLLDGFERVLSFDADVFEYKKPSYSRLLFKTDGSVKNWNAFSEGILSLQFKSSAKCMWTLREDLEGICTLTKVNQPEVISFEDLSPLEVIRVMEGLDIDLARKWPYPNRPESSVGIDDILYYFAHRDNHENSENDLLFHEPVDASYLQKPDVKNSSMLEKVESIEDSIPGVYSQLSMEDAEKVKEQKLLIRDIQDDLDSTRKRYDRYFDRVTHTSEEAFEIGYRPNLAHAFIEARFKVSKRDGKLRAYHWIKGYKESVILACLDLSTGENLQECSINPRDGFDESSKVIMADNFSLDAETGVVKFDFDLDNAIAAGYLPKERSQSLIKDSFLDLDLSKIDQNSHISLELEPGIVNSALEILSGKIFIKKGQEILERGVVSFWDQNL